MREHKYRAWDIKRKLYFHVVSIFFEEKRVEIVGNGFRTWVDLDQVILEQYTGLKDKNGEDDYVGNIWEVLFEGRKVRFVRTADLDWSGYVFDFICPDRAISPVHANVSEDGEIIGHIHES